MPSAQRSEDARAPYRFIPAASIPTPRDDERVGRELLAMHLSGRLSEPKDVGNLAVWLASDESTFVTDHVYVIDGGCTTKLPLSILSPGCARCVRPFRY
ncbi:SDR family oxidoreductase [Ensifer aridi]|uniref:SDR family oxidoreductase n=1 Tax=Ensifer aridi TaxID=1708715 RepID=UPI000A111504|nr:SDR family oxidoreductase [Ensifer aridi]